jgi:hypothetical protein
VLANEDQWEDDDSGGNVSCALHATNNGVMVCFRRLYTSNQDGISTSTVELNVPFETFQLAMESPAS